METLFQECVPRVCGERVGGHAANLDPGTQYSGSTRFVYTKLAHRVWQQVAHLRRAKRVGVGLVELRVEEQHWGRGENRSLISVSGCFIVQSKRRRQSWR